MQVISIRAPMFDTSFINSQTSHDRNPDAKNEKIMSFELGYGYRSRFFTANLNGYYTVGWIKPFTIVVRQPMVCVGL